ncbi:MAG: transcription-repair coupling factor [Alphaproteobacteria bacterium]|nr:transcription-repair coupling factor [Alphaproteobacteria bacterium]
MTIKTNFLNTEQSSTISIPIGFETYLLGTALTQSSKDLIFITQDDRHLQETKEALDFFAPNHPKIIFPAWDCLPYDRVSPTRDLIGQRIASLASILNHDPKQPIIILTTSAAILQKIPKKTLFEGATRLLKQGLQLNLDDWASYLTKIGYNRTETVREVGEFALRGGIFDIFPSGLTQPIRLDLFGNNIEKLKYFDALTQRSLSDAGPQKIFPMGEILLNETTIQRFRSKYRQEFGIQATEKDQLYNHISQGHFIQGAEHWLPLFYDELSTLFDYLPNASIILGHDVEESIVARFEQINEFYQARLDFLNKGNDNLYYPLNPNALYLMKDEWQDNLTSRLVHIITKHKKTDDAEDAFQFPPIFSHMRLETDQNIYDLFKTWLKKAQSNHKVILACHSEGSLERLSKIMKDHGLQNIQQIEAWSDIAPYPKNHLLLTKLPLSRGFYTDKVIFVAEEDLLGERIIRNVKRRRSDEFIAEVTALEVGDHVVHLEHGIGQFDGIETIRTLNVPHDCLRVLYQGGDKLYIPVENIDVLTRYGSESESTHLDKLGQLAWQQRKSKIKERIQEMAQELIQIAALRAAKTGETLQAPIGAYDEFCARFPYPETDDQLSAISDVLSDLTIGKPMDRLICGDVGFGKTEVALRAAFQAAISGAQVAVVVPTTLLALQHYKNFQRRFEGFPLRIQKLSRFNTAKEQANIKKELSEGKVDIVIGTHAILSKDISIPNLGLLIIDEEQHFGVAQKERLKQIKPNVHILTLTATPIPRTLQMALSGVRDLSLIATPPIDRLAVRSFVLPFDGVIIREAILRERHRGGQIFYICPRLADIPKVTEKLLELVPDIKYAIAHGKLSGHDLEELMQDFMNKKYDLLIATNIVESGLDIPSVNTLIVHKSDHFGLSQLYQLRGRVGRGKTRAYAYFTTPYGKKITKPAEKRLHVLETLDHLGAGFTLASHDLDIRGAGNMLGDEQSGHIKEVGVELYQNMLQEALLALKEDKPLNPDYSPQIHLGIPILIPEGYVKDLNVRMSLYRRASNLKNKPEIDSFAAELIDRFGPLPQEVENLFDVLECKRLCLEVGIEKADCGPKGAVISFYKNTFKAPDKLINYIQKQVGSVKLRPDHKLIFVRAWPNDKVKMAGLKKVLLDLRALLG